MPGIEVLNAIGNGPIGGSQSDPGPLLRAGDLTPPQRIAAYLSAFGPHAGVRQLHEQKDAVDRVAAEVGGRVAHYHVDHLRAPERGGIAPGLSALGSNVTAGNVDVVIVEHVDRFAPDRDEAMLIAVSFAAAGIRVVESRIAIRDAARMRRGNRRSGAVGRRVAAWDRS